MSLRGKKAWTSQSIRELAREHLRQQMKQPLAPGLKTPVEEESELIKVERSEGPVFHWGAFQQSTGDRVYAVLPWDEANEGDEIVQLCSTLGLECVEIETLSKNRRPDAATFVGSGRLGEIAKKMRARHCAALVVDAHLSPVQVRNIEQIIGAPVLDRESVILTIFQHHAKSRLAKMQVELAQLKYLQPRLAGLWSGLSRQRGSRGGLGGRGLGETRLELDRRVVKNRISSLTRKLKEAEKSLAVQSKGRARFPRVALVGYTNAGKSTLMRLFTGADVEARDSLFVTLDTTVRALQPPTEPRILMSDTVGFVKKLPHDLVASFKSTLQEALDSQLILHVLDASHPQWRLHFETTEAVLEEIGAGNLDRFLILNKIDKLGPFARLRLSEITRVMHNHPRYKERYLVSALTGQGFPLLRKSLVEHFGAQAPRWAVEQSS